MFSYETGQVLIVVFCCLIIIGFGVWVFTNGITSKSIGNFMNFKSKKSVRFGDVKIREIDSDEE